LNHIDAYRTDCHADQQDYELRGVRRKRANGTIIRINDLEHKRDQKKTKHLATVFGGTNFACEKERSIIYSHINLLSSRIVYLPKGLLLDIQEPSDTVDQPLDKQLVDVGPLGVDPMLQIKEAVVETG
jgi:hypothetical protein